MPPVASIQTEITNEIGMDRTELNGIPNSGEDSTNEKAQNGEKEIAKGRHGMLK